MTWVVRTTSGATLREWTSEPNVAPSVECNTGWEDASTIDAWIRTILAGTITRNVQHRKVCTRVPSADYCNRLFCYALRPYAWDVRNDWRWEELV